MIDRMVSYEPLPELPPAVVASEQISDAILHLDRDLTSLVSWPYPELDALTGPMGEGEVWFVPAFSGGGKTTFIVSTIEAWRRAGLRIYVMPLELQPKRFRTYLACMQTGTHPGDALSGLLRRDPNRKHEREQVREALFAQMQPAFADHVMISEQRAINLAGLEDGLKEAKAFGAHVVIVDHIDHIEGDGRNGLYAASKAVNHGALRMAQDNGLLLVFTSQLNMDISRGDHLAKYGPPMVQHVQFPSVKLQVTTGMIGLYRPLRDLFDGESDEEYAKALKLARSGAPNAPNMLEPNTMGVTMMKLRNFGQHDGQKIKLGFERGRVTPIAEKDRYQTSYTGLRRL